MRSPITRTGAFASISSPRASNSCSHPQSTDRSRPGPRLFALWLDEKSGRAIAARDRRKERIGGARGFADCHIHIEVAVSAEAADETDSGCGPGQFDVSS